MGRAVLQGICTALLVTALTLIAGIIWTSSGIGIVSISRIVDIGLLASCLVGGYRTGKQTNSWFLGTLVGIGYVTIGSLLLAVFTPISGTGFLQVLLTGAFLGSVAGVFGTGSTYRKAFRGLGTKRALSYPWSECNDLHTDYKFRPLIYEQEDILSSEDNKYEGEFKNSGSFKELSLFEDKTGAGKNIGELRSPWWEEECTTDNV
jgi:putative membrane protein (TIGR04086 family)